MNNEGDGYSSSGGDKKFGEWPAWNTRAFYVKLLDLFLMLGLYGAFFYLMMGKH